MDIPKLTGWIAEQIGRFAGIIAVGVGAEFPVTEKKISEWQGAPV
jgi:hypothetical protein